MTNAEFVRDRLDAWADSAHITAKGLSDIEAQPWLNQEANYRRLVALLAHPDAEFSPANGVIPPLR